MEKILAGGILAFLITYIVIPVIIVIAKGKKLYDEPDDKRKLHKQPIPYLGGLGMFIGFIMSLLLIVNFTTEAPEFQYYTAAFLLIFFLGIKDDIMVLSPAKKFIGQVIAAIILIYKAKLFISNMGGFMGVYEMNEACSYILSAFSIVVIINAFNLIDGVDGLAGSLGMISCLVFGTYFLVNQNIPYAVLAYSFAGSLLAFLKYNFYPAKIFMGDTGSLMVGLVNSVLVIKFIETAGTYTLYPVASAPAIGFGILLLPLMDTLRVFAIRITYGRSPFSPDRNHVHHLLLNKGFSHKNVTITCIVAAISISALTFLFDSVGTGLLIASQITIFFSLIYLLHYKKSHYNLRVVKAEIKAEIPEEKVPLVPLFDKKAAVVDEE